MAIAKSVFTSVKSKTVFHGVPRLVPKDGEPGIAATVQVNSVTTLPPGSPATVVNVGTANAALFDFGIPTGGDGEDGLIVEVRAGTNVSVDNTDPARPIVSASGGGGGGSGTVTSVAISLPTGLDVSGSPITTSGTFAITYAAGYTGYTSAEASKLAGVASGATANTGTVTSASITLPTGLQVSGSPITTSGTFAITFASGYSIPTNTKQGQWDTAYGWGNHASGGYLTTVAAAAAYQPLDADLTTIAGLTATTNNFMVAVSSAWASRTPAQVRTTLALVIGTDVQAYNAGLTSWAGVTRAAGFDTFAATSSSANLRALLTDETGTGAAVFGTSPAIATPALTDPVITGTITEDVYTITDGAAFAIDPRNGSVQQVTLGASRTPTAANWVSGDSVHLKVADGTAYTITWSTIGVVWVGGSAPTLATSGFTHIVLWRDGSTYYGKYVGDTAS